MKTTIKMMVIAAFSTALFMSCEPNETVKPVIQNVELGMQNSKTATVGGDLHVEADIIAEGKIASIRLVIHPEGEEAHVPAYQAVSKLNASEEWELDSIYTGVYANLKNTQFHEHIDIPADAPTGEYHLHLIVTDLEGNQTTYEDEIELLAPVE